MKRRIKDAERACIGVGGYIPSHFLPLFSPCICQASACRSRRRLMCGSIKKKPQNGECTSSRFQVVTLVTQKKSTTACAMGRLDLNIRYPCLDSRSAPPPCALQLNMGDGRNKYPNEEEQSDGVRAHTPKKGKGRGEEFLHGRFKRVEICLAVSFSVHHVAFSNNYSVHCCAHIMLGRSAHTRQRDEFRSKSPPRFRPQYAPSATRIVRAPARSASRLRV